jgi:hypothetical protein
MQSGRGTFEASCTYKLMLIEGWRAYVRKQLPDHSPERLLARLLLAVSDLYVDACIVAMRAEARPSIFRRKISVCDDDGQVAQVRPGFRNGHELFEGHFRVRVRTTSGGPVLRTGKSMG